MSGQCGKDTAYLELEQLHKQSCFTPIHVKDMTAEEKEQAQQALMLLTEKPNGTVKGQCVFNGKPTCEFFTKKETTSPTTSLEGLFLTSVIDAKKNAIVGRTGF